MCLWNKKGKCRNGELCRYAHSADELVNHQLPSLPLFPSGRFEDFVKSPEPMKVEPTIFVRAPQRLPEFECSPAPSGPLPFSPAGYGALSRSIQSGLRIVKSPHLDWESEVLLEDIKCIKNQIAALSIAVLAASGRSQAGSSSSSSGSTTRTVSSNTSRLSPPDTRTF
eukprot:CAMPEP_0170593898 /NCGR_PEP_ID=MMETSP0224-20130122/13707_1 /TAXON_ID=285029 /ORGANISM="Togula jolla, Strain CCCM 725" /LENGTH=167 /DNA_ID=CAMNT_0010917909 /DNA_START=421 /DNA_END=924 /DNA_ORIENTATION=+